MSKLPDDVAIRVQDVHKDFHLPHHHDDSIKHRIITAFEKKDKTIDVHHALQGISFDIKKGEFFGILGRNGSGKSTLLKIISEIYQPTKGSVAHQGKLVAFIELGVGFNSQLSGRDNVYLNASLLGFSRKEIEAMYDDIVEFAELEEFMEQKLKNYSSGMKVRLAFSVAIRANADILILDEVLAVGDASFQRKCYDYFKSLKLQHKTVVLVSHSMGAIREYCDRAVLIENGIVAHEGTADEIADEYLKLFGNNNKPKSPSEKPLRWGSKEVEITNTSFKMSRQWVKIKFHLKNNTTIKQKIGINVDFYDSKEKLVGGVEAIMVPGAIFDVSGNGEATIEYRFENIFGGNKYSAAASVRDTHNNAYDFIRKAIVFENQYIRNDYFPVVMPVKITRD